jgi:TRAP-type C4-dicarboxylate transport system permease large subunit
VVVQVVAVAEDFPAPEAQVEAEVAEMARQVLRALRTQVAVAVAAGTERHTQVVQVALVLLLYVTVFRKKDLPWRTLLISTNTTRSSA